MLTFGRSPQYQPKRLKSCSLSIHLHCKSLLKDIILLCIFLKCSRFIIYKGRFWIYDLWWMIAVKTCSWYISIFFPGFSLQFHLAPGFLSNSKWSPWRFNDSWEFCRMCYCEKRIAWKCSRQITSFSRFVLDRKFLGPFPCEARTRFPPLICYDLTLAPAIFQTLHT